MVEVAAFVAVELAFDGGLLQTGCLEDAVFAFAGVDEEPDLLDEVFEGDAFGDAFFAACLFASFAVGLAA